MTPNEKPVYKLEPPWRLAKGGALVVRSRHNVTYPVVYFRRPKNMSEWLYIRIINTLRIELADDVLPEIEEWIEEQENQ